MNRILKSRVVNFALFFSLALILLYYAFRSVDFAHLREGFRNVNYYWISLSLLIALLSHMLRAIRWGYLMEPLGSKPRFANLFSAVMFGFMANLALPRFGEVAKCGSIRKTDGIRFEALIGTVVVERVADLVMLILATVAVILVKLDTFGLYIYQKIVHPIQQRAVNIEGYKLVIVLAIFMAFLLGLRFIIRSDFLGERFNGRLKAGVKGVVDGLKTIYHTPKVFGFVLLSILIWLGYWFMTWALLYSTPITAGLNGWDALFIMVIGSYGMTVPVQGGFGAYHIITATAMSIFGITYENGLIFAVISHESQTFILILGGIIALVYLYFAQRKQKENWIM